MVILESHTVENVDDRERFIDYCIGVFPAFSTRNSVKKALKRDELRINGQKATTGIWVYEGDRIDYIDPQHQLPKEYPLEVEIVYEDDYLAVVNKPSGIVVSGNLHRTLENALIGKIKLSSQSDALKWAKPVHRLDAATSGLVIFAKTAESHRRLSKLFEQKLIQKTYRAIVQGEVEDQTISAPVERKPSESQLKRISAVPSLQNEVLSLVELFPKTGRTHQLRIHCASIGSPIVGDKLHGEEGNIMNHKGLFLSAVHLEFLHPMTSERMEISTPQPHKFDALLEREERRWKSRKG